MQQLHEWLSSERYPWLEHWLFHPRLVQNGGYTSCLQGFWECLSCLHYLEDQLQGTSNRESVLAEKLNRDPLLDAKVVEAVKIVMFKAALELYTSLRDGSPCPMFATVIFSRPSSATPEDLFANHLNRIGREQSIQEVELYLLGYALRTTLTVVRPQRLRGEDCVCRYPEWQLGTWSEVVLLEHDARYWVCTS